MKRTRIFNAAASGLVSVALLFTSGTGFAEATAVETPPVVDEQPPAPKPAPVIVISSYKTSKKRLVAGSTFKLVLDVRNETARHAENVVVSLSSAGAASSAEGAGAAGGLTVLGTGNSKFVGTIRGKTTKAVAFRVVAAGGTPPGAAAIPVTVSFEYDGERHEQSHTVGLVFERDVALRVATAEVPTEARVGEPFEASFELANAGGFAVQGMSLGVQADGAKVTDGSAFIGALEPAATEALDVTVVPERPGKLDVVFTATYRDDLGKERKFSKTYTVDVEDQPKPSEGEEPGAKKPQAKGSWLSRFLLALIGLGT